MSVDRPDEVWSLLVHAVIDSRTDWRRAVAARTGIPFSRVRVLKRLRRYGPMPLKELATACDMDAPAATVAVNDLEARGYVERTVSPDDRRCKIVSLMPAGNAVIDAVATVEDPAPEAIRALAPDDLARLAVLARALAG